MAKNRWELEKKRKQEALAAMQAALKSGAAYKGNAVQQTVSSPVNPKTAQSTLNTARSQSSTQRSSSGGGGGNPANTSGKTTTTRSNTLPGLEALPSFGSPTLRTPSASAQRQNYLSGASERRRTNVDSRTGRSRAMDERDLQLNMARWHNTTDEAERQRLNRENDAIRARLGLSYDPSTGVTYDARTGRNYSLPTQLLYGGTAAQRARAANQFPYSREAVGEDADSISMRPTMQQIAAGVGREASGVNAHRVMNDLFSRSAETWTDEDTRNRDAAVQALSDEMDRIMQQYGMRYSESGLGTGAWGMPDMVSDRTAIDRLREAGADETTIAYVQENIGLREAANRFGQGAEAVFKRTVGSPKAFVETVQQQAANVAESRENPEYVQLEEQERQLEAQLQSMNPQNYDGSAPQEYLDIYNQLQEVRERKNQLAVNTPTDQNLWGQTMLREAAEAQANATAGLSTVPRFLANQSISIAGNAPVMATSLIPGVGPVVGATLMGASAAGQRVQELSAEGAAPSEALGRGIVSGVIEAVTEKLPIDALADILNRGGTDVVRNILRQMGIEATEESASYVMNFASDWAANDPNAEFSFAELAENALGGALSGGVFGAAGTLGGRARAGAQTAQETAEAPQAGNYPPVMQDAVQGDLGQNVSPSGFIVPEAKRRRMAAQDAEYAAQIDGVFNGSMPTDRVVSIGDTPDILLSIGATDLPMTMTQSTARKIAFPAGYMGGSHNLGIPALKRLPEQMRDPAAVLRSKTQPDSFVILTEWNDTNGNPVIIALHLDKQGVVDVTNEVASAYGKNNFAALTGENGENVLYTKNNKSIDQILDNRLQLPALLSDDTLVAYSIAQNSGEGKRQEAINEIDLTPATAIRRSTTGGHIAMQSGLFNNSIAQNGGEGNRQEAINEIDEIDLTQGDAMHQSLSGSGVQPRSGLSSNSISQTDGNSNPVQADSQAIGLRLAELDSAMRTAESLLPGPARDARIAEIRAEMEQVQAETAEPTTVQDSTGQMTMREFQQQRQAQAARDFASDGEPIQAEQSATTTVNVPVTAAIQYGATPQQAMREAEVRAHGEAAQAARETQLSQDIRQSNPTMRPDNPYFGLSRQQLEMERDFARQRLERARSDRRPERAQSMQTQLDQIEAALEDAQQHDFKRGDRVFALDRNNFGEIIDDRGDGYFDVYFVNGQTGENGIHTLHGDLLQSIVPGEDVPRLTPKDAAEITGDITDYSPEEFDRIVSEAPDQYEAMPKRDLSRFGGGRLRGGEEQMQKDIEAMTEEADQQGAKQIVPESVARNISPVHMAYNKTLERVLDEAAGVSETIRTFFRDTIEKPLAYAKGLYARNIKTQMDDYYKAMQETGIRLGSKESAAVMWYGEGQRVNEEGDIEKYTLEHLKRDFPKKWKDIVKADSVNRRIYDEYIQKIQKARREVYPYAEQRVELAINRRRAQAAAFSEQIKNLDAKIASGTATAAETASRRQLMRELQRTEQDLAQKIKDRDSGKAFANQRLFPRKDFYHHTMEMAQGFSALKNILDVDSNIDPRLVGKSDNTRPNAKWSGILQRRRGVNALEDSVAAMLDYIPQAEYMINIDPQVARMRTIVRDLVDGTANADQTNANSLIEWLTDYTNDLAGKTNPFDRALQKVVSRKAFKALEWLNGRAKSNAILGNLNSALSQVYNLPNGLAYIHDPRDISAGLVDFAAAKAGNDRANSILQSSNFLTERYLDKAQKQFDESLLHKPKQFAEWLMTAGDEQVAQMIYFSAYEQALRRGEADPVFYADDITRRAIAGRGVGETPLMQKSKIVQLIAPFQVEVSNAYYVIKEKIGARDALGLTLLFLSTFLLNELKEDLTGTRTGMDLIDAGSDAIKEVLDPEYEGNTLNKMLTVATRLGGEVLSNMPFGSQIASTLVPDETRRTKLFGESDPTRFGTGNIGINALLEPVGQFLSGQEVNPWDPLTNLVMPWGGRQASRVVDMAEDYGLLPIFRIGQDGVRADRQDVQASYSDDGSRLRFPMDTDIGDILKGLAFGRYATDAGKAYIEGGLKMLSEDKTAAFTRGVTEQGIDEATLYDVIVKIGQAEPVKDAEGNTLTSSKQVARRMLFDRDDLTAEQKRWIDEQLLIDPDSDQQPADYTDYNTFMLHNISDSRKDAARDAIATGLSIDQFVQWDDRLSELIGEKDENDKKVRTEAEARNIVLDEVMQDSALSDSEKQAIADYVLISSIGEEDEKARKNWETIAKGKVNASDFVRFQADASVYDAWAEGTGTDNTANVAEILRGYDGLTDEQRDVLFQTYRDNMSVNPFHVSVYEKSIDPNGSFYGALTDDGKARLRSLLNEYEQDINEGAELDEWRAKAYMAEKEAGISPATYAMYRVALETANTDDKGNPRQSEAEACVNAMDGLTQYQKAYLYASTNKSWKNNPFGSATVGEYSSGQEVGINPVAGAKVTSRFGPRKSFQTDNGAMSSSLHPSIDIGAAEGTPIDAYKSGKVTQNGWVDGYGWTIEVTHSDGTVSAYHHMMEQSPVAVGTEVKQGEQIGKVGQTGNSKGAHLDLTITRDGKPIDPATLIPELQDSATGYVWTGSNVYTNVTSGSGQSSGSSGGSSGSKKKSGFSSNPFDSFVGFKGF